MYSENPEGTQVIVGSMNMDIYIYIPTLPGIELTTCSVPSVESIPLGHKLYEQTRENLRIIARLE